MTAEQVYAYQQDDILTVAADIDRPSDRIRYAFVQGYKAADAEHERYRQRSRDEDTVRIRLNHERIRLRDALELIAQGVWTAPNSVETIVYAARQALKDQP